MKSYICAITSNVRYSYLIDGLTDEYAIITLRYKSDEFYQGGDSLNKKHDKTCHCPKPRISKITNILRKILTTNDQVSQEEFFSIIL